MAKNWKKKITVDVLNKCLLSSVADLHHFDVDGDPDSACHFDADADPFFHFDADPDTDSSFQIKAQNLEKVLK
jgi:hypothetical protein